MAATGIVGDLKPGTRLAATARVAGLLYLVAVVLGPFSLIYVPSVIFASGNAAATADNIRSHEMLLRLGIFGDVLTGTVFLFVVLGLYRLLKDVDRTLASIMVILGGIVPLPIFCINAMNWLAALSIAHGAGYWLTFSKEQRDALTMLFVQLHHEGNIINSVFWGTVVVAVRRARHQITILTANPRHTAPDQWGSLSCDEQRWFAVSERPGPRRDDYSAGLVRRARYNVVAYHNGRAKAAASTRVSR